MGDQWAVNIRGYPERQMARTILVVDDEPTLREAVVDALEADGFRVVAAADGREALSQFLSRAIGDEGDTTGDEEGQRRRFQRDGGAVGQRPSASTRRGGFGFGLGHAST